MSEVKLNLTDARRTIQGTIHGSIVDRAVAALSAEPETIQELTRALARYIKLENDERPFELFHESNRIDDEPWDAGIVIIDLAARIVAVESTYSQPGRSGQVTYHDGTSATSITISYRVSDDWLFLHSIDEYEVWRSDRMQQRLATPPLDARAVLYGRPLLEFIYREVAQTLVCGHSGALQTPDNHLAVSETSLEASEDTEARGQTTDEKRLTNDQPPGLADDSDDVDERIASEIHARWLMTTREDLRNRTPREVLLEKQDFIDYDLHTRELQWSLQGEAPPVVATNSFAYRYGGFGTQEWVIYYDLVRDVLRKTIAIVRNDLACCTFPSLEQGGSSMLSGGELKFVEQAEIDRLEEFKRNWLETPHREYDNRTPAILIQSERQRLPITISGRELIIDEDCPICQMMAADSEFGLEITFWSLDGAHMDDDFLFSHFRTQDEWEADRLEWQAFSEKFRREWNERRESRSLTEDIDDIPF